jgi:hypothetical protein
MGGNNIVSGASKLELIKRGEIIDGKTKTDIDFENKKLSEEERMKNSKWIGEIGSKIDLEVKVIAEFHFEGRFGTTYTTKFIDREGNTIVYMGQPFIPVPEQYLFVEKLYQIKNDEVAEIENPFLEPNPDLWKKLPKKMYQLGGEENTDGTMRFHTWYTNSSSNDVSKELLELLKKLSNSGKLPVCNYIDEKHKLYLISYTEERFQSFDKGDWILLSGTISKHDEYKEEKQTFLQRPKFVKKLS